MEKHPINEARLYDELAELLLQISNTCKQLANLHRNASLSRATDFSSEKTLFCCITKAAYDKGVAQTVEDELRSACVSAPKLVKAIRTNEALGYLDTQNLSSRVLFGLLKNHIGLPFKERCFMYYRSK